jgi:hypothetical protein
VPQNIGLVAMTACSSRPWNPQKAKSSPRHSKAHYSGQKICHVHGHLVDLRRVVELDIPQNPHIVAGHEVDSDTLSPESATTTDSVDVVLSVAGKIIIDHQADLLDIDASGPDVSTNQDSAVALAEVAHNTVSFFLWHFPMHTADGEVCLAHLVCQPVHLTTSVAEDDSLRNCQSIIQVTESVKFPFFFLHSDEILFESFKGQLVTLDEDSNRICHEFRGHVQHIIGQRSRNDDDLGCRREVAINIVDLFAKAPVEQLVGFIKHKHFDVPSAKVASSDHIGNPTRGARYNVLAIVKLSYVFTNICTTDTGVALHVHVVAECHDNALDLRS